VEQRGHVVRTQTLVGLGAQLVAIGGGVLIGPGVAVVFVVLGLGAFALAGAGTERVQRSIPSLGRVPWVNDHGFRVVSAESVGQLDRIDEALEKAKAALEERSRPERQRITFADIKPRIEQYIEEGRDMYAELMRGTDPDRTGALYDATGEWAARVYADLDSYHSKVAEEFEWGGAILSPQLRDIPPTDRDTLMVYIRRRGQVLRNVLDGTPRKDLKWPEEGF
jgi:hypothetical protein